MHVTLPLTALLLAYALILTLSRAALPPPGDLDAHPRPPRQVRPRRTARLHHAHPPRIAPGGHSLSPSPHLALALALRLPALTVFPTPTLTLAPSLTLAPPHPSPEPHRSPEPHPSPKPKQVAAYNVALYLASAAVTRLVSNDAAVRAAFGGVVWVLIPHTQSRILSIAATCLFVPLGTP